MLARLSERKCAKGRELRLWLLSTQPEKEVSASDVLRTVSHLNLVELVAPGGFCHRRGGWGILNASGVMDKTRKRPRSADCPVRASEGFRNDENRLRRRSLVKAVASYGARGWLGCRARAGRCLRLGAPS